MRYWNRAWTLVEGCTAVSDGCDHCWAAQASYMRSHQKCEKIHARHEGLTAAAIHRTIEPFSAYTVPQFVGIVRPQWDALNLPAKVKKPTTWAIWNDLFHEDVPFDFVDRAFAMMMQHTHHQFLLLTKRPKRLADYMNVAFDRVAALLYNSTHENRNGVFGNGTLGRTRNRFSGADMADEEAPGPGSGGGRGISERIKNLPMPACACGMVVNGISPNCKNARGTTDNDGSTPGSVGLFQWPNSAGPNYQSQKRPESRQPSLQSGTSNIQRTAQTRSRSPECESESSSWIETPQNTSDGIRRTQDSRTEGNGNNDQGHCSSVSDETKGNLSNLLPKDMAAYLDPLFPPHIFFGVTAENQEMADLRLPELMKVNGNRWVSVEPMLSAVDLRPYLPHLGCVVCGSETGKHKRPMQIEWARSLRDQCAEAGVPFFFKMGSDGSRLLDGREHNDLAWELQKG